MCELDILNLLNTVDCNTTVDVEYTRTRGCDFISVETKDFILAVSEYGDCKVVVKGDVIYEKNVDIYKGTLVWVKKYFSEIV